MVSLSTSTPTYVTPGASSTLLSSVRRHPLSRSSRVVPLPCMRCLPPFLVLTSHRTLARGGGASARALARPCHARQLALGARRFGLVAHPLPSIWQHERHQIRARSPPVACPEARPRYAGACRIDPTVDAGARQRGRARFIHLPCLRHHWHEPLQGGAFARRYRRSTLARPRRVG